MHRFIKLAFSFALWFAIITLLRADSNQSNFFTTYNIYKTAQPIKIDGKMDEKAWEDAQRSPVFADIAGGHPARYPVAARMLWDDQYLYIGFEVTDPNLWGYNIIRDVPMAGEKSSTVLLKNATGGWGAYKENVVEIFLDPNKNSTNYAEMHFSILNTICDKIQKTPSGKAACERADIKFPGERKVKYDPSWNCPGLKSAVHIEGSLNDPYDEDKGWTIEIAIPFESLKTFAENYTTPPKIGESWRMLLARRHAISPDAAAADFWTWPVIGEANTHNPDRWGYAVFQGVREKVFIPDEIKNLAKGNFTWKTLCARMIKTKKEADTLVGMAKSMNCNVIVIQTIGGGTACYLSKLLPQAAGIEPDTLKTLINLAHQNNIQVYAWMVNLLVNKKFAEIHQELLQQVRPWEEENSKIPQINPDRLNVHPGNWLCPDRGLTDYEKNIISEFAGKFDFDGIMLDYVGYRNYYACFCPYSLQQRQQFADEHPELNEKEIITMFSEDCLIKYVEEVRKTALTVKKNLKFSIHIYPDFDLNPTYGNRLPVEYCGQTIAWFYKPFWSYGKIYDLCMKYKEAEGKFVEYNKFVPFIGVYPGDRLKSAERLRTEIRIAGKAENGTIMFAFAETFLQHPELAKIVAEEMTPEIKNPTGK